MICVVFCVYVALFIEARDSSSRWKSKQYTIRVYQLCYHVLTLEENCHIPTVTFSNSPFQPLVYVNDI